MMLIMTENDVNPHIDNDPMEKRNEFIDHPSYIPLPRVEMYYFKTNEKFW